MGKRGATVGSGSPAKKGRHGVSADVQSKIGVIVAALEDDSLQSEVTMGARQMLAKGAPAALATVVEERHQLQDVVMGHIREAFADIASRLEAKAAAAKETSEAQKAVLAEHTAKVQAASSELEVASGATQVEAEKLAAEQEALTAAEREVKLVETQQKANAKERAAIEKEKSKYTGIEEGTLKPLVEGGFATEKEAQKAINKLVKDLEKMGAESAMMVSLPPVLLKKPEERKGFDNMVLDSVKGILTTAIATVDAKFVDVDAKAAELETERADKATVVEKAQAARASQDAAWQAAKAASGDKANAKAEVDTAAEMCRLELEERCETASGADADLKAFAAVDEALAALAARSSAPPPEEAPQAATETVTEEAVAAAA